jgi:hypothetical protein
MSLAIAAMSFTLALCCVSPASAKVPGNLPGPTVPRSFARMFDGQCFSNKIFILEPPFLPSPVPVGAIARLCSNSIAFNATNGALAVTSGAAYGSRSVDIYNPPYSSSSVPTVSLSTHAISDPRQIAWDGSGNIWVADDIMNSVYEFKPPFAVSSAPAATNRLATQPAGLAINPNAGLMFIGDLGGSKSCTKTCYLYVVRAPYTGAAVATFAFGTSTPTAIAVDRLGRLFVGFDKGAFSGLIKVYLPPFVTGESAAYRLTVGNPIENMAFDSEQNLYVQRYDTGGVAVFNGPIMRSIAAPSAALGCPSGATCGVKNWAGLGFGP